MKTIRDLAGHNDHGRVVTVTTKAGHSLVGELTYGTIDDLLPPRGRELARRGNWALRLEGGYEVQLLADDQIEVGL